MSTPNEPHARLALVAPDALRVGEPAQLVFRLEDPDTGAPVTGLPPYLGAPAHVVILNQAGTSFAHTHGEAVGTTPAVGTASAGSGHAADGHAHTPASGGYGPDIAFTHTFPAPGLYKIWGQFQAQDGHVMTADFVVRVDD